MTDKRMIFKDAFVLFFGVLSLLLLRTFSSPVEAVVRYMILGSVLVFIAILTAMSYFPGPDSLSTVNIVLPAVFAVVFAAAYLIPVTGLRAEGAVYDSTAALFVGTLLSRFLIDMGLLIGDNYMYEHSGTVRRKKAKAGESLSVRVKRNLEQQGTAQFVLKSCGWFVLAAAVVLIVIGYICG